jgi:hypothetical protein
VLVGNRQYTYCEALVGESSPMLAASSSSCWWTYGSRPLQTRTSVGSVPSVDDRGAAFDQRTFSTLSAVIVCSTWNAICNHAMWDWVRTLFLDSAFSRIDGF